MLKMLVSDYDQTFYLNDNDIEQNKIAVDEFRKEGNIFVIATGRSFFDFKKKANEYNISYDYLIINHGSTILDKNDNIIINYSIDNDIIKEMVNDLDLNNSINSFCCNIDNSRLDFNSTDLTKIHVKYASKDTALSISNIINQKYSNYVNCYYVTCDAVEIISNQTNKSKAIAQIMDIEKIKRENIYTIGDSFSDIEMIKNFNGYCMKNSVKELLTYCSDRIVNSVTELFNKLYLDDLYVFLNNYDFFKNLGNYEICMIQDYRRKSKFKIRTKNKIYTLILSKDRIEPYICKFNKLGNVFKDIVGYVYLSADEKVLVLDYFGDEKGIDIVKLEKSNFDVNDDIYIKQFKEIIDNIHSNKMDFINFNNNCNYTTWKDYYLDEIEDKISSIYKQRLITDTTYKLLLNKLYISAEELCTRETCLIHADMTPLNVCINTDQKQLYLIDYDDFKIGDPLIDISRIINCKYMSKIFYNLVERYYKNYENNINHLFYTLRVHISWYNHIVKNNHEKLYDLESAKSYILEVINKIVGGNNE